MSANEIAQNGYTSRTTSDPLSTLLNIRNGRLDDLLLFELFATLAKEAGRYDLHAEFTRRAAGGSTPALALPQAPTASPKPTASVAAFRISSSGDSLSFLNVGKAGSASLPSNIRQLHPGV